MSEEELSQDQDANTAEENEGVAGPELLISSRMASFENCYEWYSNSRLR